ncbi:alcohol dehydrogenase catalytic domain-containing protein [bacterium]|nr:alcohol dehydrogenase catalytic domain-containing protein [bacterium]
MKAIRIANHGGSEAMEYAEVADPTLAENQVLIKIAFSGVNFIDVYQRTGLYPVELPYTLGLEAAGIIEKTGSQVRDFKKR